MESYSGRIFYNSKPCGMKEWKYLSSELHEPSEINGVTANGTKKSLDFQSSYGDVVWASNCFSSSQEQTSLSLGEKSSE